MDRTKVVRSWFAAVLSMALASVLWAGCASPSGPTYKFDPIEPSSGAPPAASQPAPNPAQAQLTSTSAPALVTASPDAATSAASQQDQQSGRVLRVGDGITVTFQDLGLNAIPPIDTTIKEDGTITLMYNKQFVAANKTVGQLESDIRAAYVPNYFVNMTPTVVTKERWFYVDGEVKGPGRQVYLNKMTVLGAIATSGGFTDYARKGRVQLTRANGQKYYVNTVDARKHPEKDLEVFPDDRVFVPKRIL